MTDRPSVARWPNAWRAYLVAGLLLIGCGDSPAPTVAGTRDSAVTTPGATAATTAPESRYVAVLAPLEAVDVSAKEAGDLTVVHVRQGDVVTANDVLAELNLAPVDEALTMARAELRSTRALLAQRDVDIAAARRAMEIEQDMLKRGVGIQKHVDEAQFAWQRAEKARDGTAAVIAEREALIGQLRRRLQGATITAPFDGAVALRYRDPGTTVSAGTPILRLIRIDSLWARFAVPPADIARLAVGDAVRVSVQSIPGTLPAVIRQMAPELDPAAQMIFVDALLSVPVELQGTLRAGLPAWVEPAAPPTQSTASSPP